MDAARLPGPMAGSPCPRCGGFVPATASFCGSCGAAVLRLPTPGPPPGRAPPHRAGSGLWLVIVVVLVAVAAAVIVVVAVVGVFGTTQHGWGTTFEVRPGAPTYEYPPMIPAGDSVQGSWSSSGVGWVNLSISNEGFPAYSGNGTGGAFSFLSDGLEYTVEAFDAAATNVTLQLSYTSLASPF
jgi:hypothetical protein